MAKVLNLIIVNIRTCGLMTSHGFGMPKVSSSKIRADQVAEIARQISKTKAMIKAHVVRDKKQRLRVIFQFDHLVDYDMTTADLLKELQKIRVDDHKITSSTDFWIIQSSYQRGKLIHEHPEPKKERE